VVLVKAHVEEQVNLITAAPYCIISINKIITSNKLMREDATKKMQEYDHTKKRVNTYILYQINDV